MCKDTHHAAVVLMNGRRLGAAEFPATAAGNQAPVAPRNSLKINYVIKPPAADQLLIFNAWRPDLTDVEHAPW